MAAWPINFDEGADRDFAKLDKSLQIRISAKIDWFSENFERINPVGLSESWSGYFKLRVEDYRIVYEIVLARREIKIVAVDHRSKIYKRKNLSL